MSEQAIAKFREERRLGALSKLWQLQTEFSLGKPDLPAAMRSSLEEQYAAAAERKQQIAADIAGSQREAPTAEQLLPEKEVLNRLLQLPETLANGSPTVGNYELSQHIDRIVCYPDGRIVMRTCKLGAAPEAIEQFRDPIERLAATKAQPNGKLVKPRRRSKLRVTEAADNHGDDLDALVHLVADPHRFAGLEPEWFWTDEFQVPEDVPWYVENAEQVFQRRQAGKMSFKDLAKEFDTSKPTVRAAVRHYLETHPDAKDEVNLSAGGRGGKRHDVRPIAEEVRRLWWDEHWSKLRLARKYDCSPTTIDMALKVAYAKTGEQVPSDADRRQHQIAIARKMLDDGQGIEAIANALRVAGYTVQNYLKQSFEAEGQPMPDLRSKEYKRRPKG